MSFVRKTQSLCPQCLRVLDARYVLRIQDEQEWIYLEKHCPQHGHFSAPIWVHLPNTPHFTQWHTIDSSHPLQQPQFPAFPLQSTKKGCPYDCGLCPQHAQHTCCALVEVTQRCNMRCPVCYATATHEGLDADISDIDARLSMLRRHAGAVNVQLSGGEPTVRNDLPYIIEMTKNNGFSFVQVNTNGLRLGTEKTYAHTLKNAGLSLVYLQWDDIHDRTYEILRGGKYVDIKKAALEHCCEAGLSVVLVVTLVKGVNSNALGDILRWGIQQGTHVRGMHIQPMSFFGRYPWSDKEAPRVTIPEVLYALETQTQGMVRASHFHPPQSEHALCSFTAVYTRNANTLQHIMHGGNTCCSQQTPARQAPAEKARYFVAQHWGTSHGTTNGDDFDKALDSLQQRFTISGMAFQDAYTIDLERLRRCHIHIAGKTGLIPFCAQNLTSSEGIAIHPRFAKTIS